MQTGLLCGITGEKAAFEKECPDYVNDPSVKEYTDEDLKYNASEVTSKFTSDAFTKLKSEQNLTAAITVGLVLGFIGAILWGIITVITELQIGYMALAIGAMVGFGMRFAGKGVDPIFGIMGAIIAIFSCLLGNFLSIIGFVANMQDLGYVETLFLFDYSLLIPIMTETLSIMTLVFFAIAGIEGYKFSFRTFTPEEVREMSH